LAQCPAWRRRSCRQARIGRLRKGSVAKPEEAKIRLPRYVAVGPHGRNDRASLIARPFMWRPSACRTASAPGISAFSWHNGRPADSPVNASRTAARPLAHDSRPVRSSNPRFDACVGRALRRRRRAERRQDRSRLRPRQCLAALYRRTFDDYVLPWIIVAP
jgi:hypothetical protein